MSMRYARHFARVYNTPLLIHPGRLDAMLPALERVLRGDSSEPVAVLDDAEEAPLSVLSGVAVIPVHGVLTHRGSYDAACNYLMGYEDIQAALGLALNDAAVASIVLDIDSPGGEVAGCFDLADKIRAASAIKPIHAAVNDLGCSAAYAIASACTSISLTRTALVGSIGVVLRHVDQSEWLKNEGIRVTQIFAGAHKVDGNPFEPLPDAVRDRFQSEINDLYGLFVSTVARHRALDERAVIATEADTYMGQAAIDHGLADAIETVHEMIYRLGASPLQAFTPKETIMATDDQAAAPVAAEQSSDQLEQPTMEHYHQGREDERARIAQILAHPQAKGREKLAHHLALSTDMSAEAAAGILEHSEQVSPAATGTPLTRLMAQYQSDPIGPEAEASPPQVLTRAQFDALSPTQKTGFLAARGTIADTQEA